jgi:hypothetical protein
MGTITWVSVFAAPQVLVASLIVESEHWYHLSHTGIALWGAVAYLGEVIQDLGTYVGFTYWAVIRLLKQGRICIFSCAFYSGRRVIMSRICESTYALRRCGYCLWCGF